jgi:hypothetical protein
VSGNGFELAQVNVARLREPLDSPLLADFVAALAPINELADHSPGFVWRLQTEDGDATAIRAFDDDLILVNMSVWASLDALAEFVYRSAHAGVMRNRRTWFERTLEAFVALWWVPAGHQPTPEEAKGRLEHLRLNGPTLEAFTFRHPFAPSGASAPRAVDEACPAG